MPPTVTTSEVGAVAADVVDEEMALFRRAASQIGQV